MVSLLKLGDSERYRSVSQPGRLRWKSISTIAAPELEVGGLLGEWREWLPAEELNVGKSKNGSFKAPSIYIDFLILTSQLLIRTSLSHWAFARQVWALALTVMISCDMDKDDVLNIGWIQRMNNHDKFDDLDASDKSAVILNIYIILQVTNISEIMFFRYFAIRSPYASLFQNVKVSKDE
jgi:hypothetical protein